MSFIFYSIKELNLEVKYVICFEMPVYEVSQHLYV